MAVAGGGVGGKESGFGFDEFGFESSGSLSPFLCGFLGGSTGRRHSSGGGDQL